MRAQRRVALLMRVSSTICFVVLWVFACLRLACRARPVADSRRHGGAGAAELQYNRSSHMTMHCARARVRVRACD